jgi:hypothetical protein
MLQAFTTIITITGYISLVVGAVLILMSKVKTDNLADLKERVEILEKEREFAREQHIENQKAISNLEGQLATYREIPLKSIATSLDRLSESNGKILRVLEGSAIIAATDREVLLNPEQHVTTQNVDKQIINNKE